MTLSLCTTFAQLAYETHDRLKTARHVGHQILEETLTDLNILELKRLHPHEIYCKTFTRPQEGVNGADWEWWLTDPTRSRWLGLRVQAKVLELKSDTFAHLHYRPKRGRGYQTTRLKKAAEVDGLIPLYCLYSHPPAGAAGWGAVAPSEAYGCALASVKDVERLRRRSKSVDFVSVMANATPWHFPMCMNRAASSRYPTGGLTTLPDIFSWMFNEGESTFGLLQSELESETETADAAPPGLPRPGVRRSPPDYVSALVRGQLSEDVGKGLRGVLVIEGPVVYLESLDEIGS